jgi:hypothetical protein
MGRGMGMEWPHSKHSCQQNSPYAGPQHLMWGETVEFLRARSFKGASACLLEAAYQYESHFTSIYLKEYRVTYSKGDSGHFACYFQQREQLSQDRHRSLKDNISQ